MENSDLFWIAGGSTSVLLLGSTWSQISLGKTDTLYVAQSDIKDYFYSLALPEPLRAYFCLPPVSWSSMKDLMQDDAAFRVPDHEGWLWPQLRVIPMGWNWAMWIAQRVHQHISLKASNLDMSRVLVEGKAAPDLSDGEVILIPYADNLNVAGVVPGRVQEIKDQIVKELICHQLPFHLRISQHHSAPCKNVLSNLARVRVLSY